MLLLALWLFLLSLFELGRGATTDSTCLSDCSAWSVTLGYCRSIYGNLPMYQNYTFANDFVGCLCVGGRSTGPPLGNETFLAQMGICSTCSPTPERTKEDLTGLLRLCAIQANNGTAADVMTYMPVGYSTINNEAYAGSLAPDSGARPRTSRSLLRMVCAVTAGVVTLSMLWMIL